MKLEKLYIETLSPIGRINNKNHHRFVVSNGFVYFVNPYKLDNVLSLMKLLYEFNDYTNCANVSNITTWVRSKKLNSKAILEEISYYKVKCNIDENSLINRFFIFENFVGEKFDFTLYLAIYLKETLKLALLFDFLTKFNSEFNKYFRNIYDFFCKNPSYLSSNKDAFIDYLLEMDKYKFKNELKRIENLKIICKNKDAFEENIIIKKSSNNYYFNECLKSNLKLDFEICQSDSIINELNLAKYLQILEITNKKRLMQKEIIKKTNSNILILEKVNRKIIKNSNLSFLSKPQILYMSMDKKNKELLKENIEYTRIFSYSYPCEIMPPDNMNYAKIELY